MLNFSVDKFKPITIGIPKFGVLCPVTGAGIAEHPQQWCSPTVPRGLGVHPRPGWTGGDRFLLHLLLGFSGSAKTRSLVSGLSLLPEDGAGYALSDLDHSVLIDNCRIFSTP